MVRAIILKLVYFKFSLAYQRICWLTGETNFFKIFHHIYKNKLFPYIYPKNDNSYIEIINLKLHI